MAMGMTVVAEEQKGKGKNGNGVAALPWGSVASEGTRLLTVDC